MRANTIANIGDEIGAIKLYLKSIEITPYYPYASFNEWKIETIKNYRNSLISDTAIKNEFLYTSPVIDDIIPIIIKNQSNKHFVEVVEEELNSILTKDTVNNVTIFYAAEVFKFLQIGKKKSNDIYLERLPFVLTCYQKIKKNSPDFPLIDLKIGIISLIKQIYDNPNERKMEDVVNYINDGMYQISNNTTFIEK
jgi:hypothetical protein